MNRNEISAPESEAEIDFGYYLYLIKSHIIKILAIAGIVTAIVYMGAKKLPPVYEASSTIMIERTQIVSVDELYGPASANDFMRTQYEILKSRGIAERVVKKLNLVDNPAFNPYHPDNAKKFSLFSFLKNQDKEPPTDSQVLKATVDNFWDSIKVTLVDRSQLVKISIESSSPEIAAIAANTMAQVYIERELESKSEGSRQAAAWLQEKLVGLREGLVASEQKLQKFRDENNLVQIGDTASTSIIAKELDMISEKLLDARSQRLDIEANYKQLKAIKTYTYDNLSGLPFIIGNPQIESLREAETSAALRVSELSERYKSKHPKMIAAQSELNSAREALLSQMKRIAAGVESSYMAARDKEMSMNAEFEAKKQEARLINKTEFTLSEYKRDVDANQELYNIFLNRIRETNETENLQSSNARVVDLATTPEFPTKPKVKIITIAAFIVTLGIGIVLLLALDFLDATIKSPKDVERKLRLPLLGVIPLIARTAKDEAENDSKVIHAFVDQDSSPGFSESVRTLRTSITLAGLDKPVQVILFTSSIPGEGKTTTSTNLAEAYGQMEKTLIIDADMRRPTMAKKIGLPHNARGLSNAVAYPDSLDECIHHVESLNIDVMPSGPIPPNPLELLSSRNFQQLLEILRGRYQRIIIDSAPTRLVSDALYLSTLADGVIYVVKADSTRDKLVKASLSRLQGSNANIIGVLLNQIDVTKADSYGYGYYSGYYDSQGYTSNTSN